MQKSLLDIKKFRWDQKTTRKSRGGVCKKHYQTIRKSEGTIRQQEILVVGYAKSTTRREENQNGP